MGVPSGGGQLGQATGSIVINTSQLAQAQAQVQAASRQMTQAFSSVNANVGQAQGSILSLSGALRGLSGAFGIGAGVAGLTQLARAAGDAANAATSYRRLEAASLQLAGSQQQLNELMDAYERATGDAVDNATALQRVTQLQAIGFADSAQELERFATVVRTISIATGRAQDFVTQELALTLANSSERRLDQIGLGVEEVQQRVEALRASNGGLTREMAFQQAVMEIAEEKYAALAGSAAAQRSGTERLTKAWKDYGTQLSLLIEGPVGGVADFLGRGFEAQIKQLEAMIFLVKQFEDGLRRLGLLSGPGFDAPGVSSSGNIGGRGASAPARPRFSDEQTAAIVEWARGVEEIERQSARDRLEATRQFEQQRSDTIRQYEQSIAREAQDFAIQRVRDEEDYALSLQRMRRDIAQREASQLADLERTIADARQDAAERGAERQAALDERIIETRSQANERIAELEADFTKRRERSQRDFADRLRDAAANLDAVAVREAQRDFRRSQQEAQEDFDERLAKERKNEEKRLAELNKTHAKQTADEGRALQKRIDQANEAYQRQLEDARAADEQRLADMSEDRAIRLERENEDRALRLERMAEDHQAQLDEMARQQELRLLQIAEQEQEARTQLDEAFQEELAAMDIRTEAYKEKLKAYETAAIEAFDRVWAHWLGTIQGPQPENPLITPGQFPSLNPSSVAPSRVTNSARTVIIQPGAVQVLPAIGMNEESLSELVVQKLADILEEITN